MDLLMWNLEVSDTLETCCRSSFELADEARARSTGSRSATCGKELHRGARCARFVEVYNAAWKENWGFVPISEEEMKHTAKECG